jgi:hypothetical protein
MLEKITEAEINERSMARVSTTPGRPTAFGQSNMDPEALKLRFDRLGRFLAGKINEILGSIEDGSIAEYIYVDHNGVKYSIEQFITNLINGDVDNIQIKINGGIVYLTEIAMKTEEMYNGLFTGDIAGKIAVVEGITLKRFYEDFLKFEANAAPVKSVNGQTGHVQLSAPDINAEVLGTAQATTERHNTSDASHADIRSALANLVQRLDALANSEDTDLDQLKEIVAYIKENKNLIDGITASKVNVSDIIDNLETNLKDKPLSASQGVALKNMIAEMTPFTKLSELDNDVGFITENDVPVRNVNGKAGEVTLNASDVGAEAAGTVNQHNADTAAHNDLRLLIQGLTERLNALANSDDTELDQLKEIVAYIKLNKDLIDGITTSKVNVADIIDNLTTNVTDKPLSAAQGVALKALIDALQSGKLDASELSTAINTALAQAKASGKFDGAPGAQGIQGYSIVASVDRPSFTTAQWDTYGEIGHAENWGATSNAGVRVGDIFLVVGTATDTGIGHMLVYKYTGEKGGNTLSGQCLAHHIVAYRGAGGAAGTSVTVSSVSESTASGGTNVVTFSDGKKVSINNGKDYVLTDADLSIIAARAIEILGGEPIFGVVDNNNNIILSGNLSEGIYTAKYEKQDGTTIEIGQLVFSYSVKNNLTNCKTNNNATSVANGGSYSATISANSGYTLSSVTVTMGGSPVSVSNGVINISKVTGDIVITATAEKADTNALPKAINADGTPFVGTNGEKGYKTGVRISGSSGGESTQPGCMATGFIAVTSAQKAVVENITPSSTDTHNVLVFYDENFTKVMNTTLGSQSYIENPSTGTYIIKPIIMANASKIRYIRFSCADLSNASVTIQDL